MTRYLIRNRDQVYGTAVICPQGARGTFRLISIVIDIPRPKDSTALVFREHAISRVGVDQLYIENVDQFGAAPSVASTRAAELRLLLFPS